MDCCTFAPRLKLCVPRADASCCRPQYYEIYKYKEVIGVSLMFMFVDMMGGVFSDLSLAFKDRFDIVAGIAYSLVVVCIFVLQ